jgi:hypothetical protein
MELFILGVILVVAMWTVDIPQSKYKQDESEELI